MVIDLKFCRFENASWGFRLIGGSDFDIPLTVVKVTEGSLAEQAGLRVGDIIVRINDEPASWMSHNDAHEYITKAGNNFFFGIMRESEEIEEKNVTEEQNNSIIRPESQNSDLTRNETPSTGIDHEIDQHTNTDDEIAELMSGEAEVLNDHNIVGVNFYRIFPKPGVCMSSEVLRTLNDENIKTAKEKEQEKRKWTTFLQKPNRPILKSKKELEEEAKRVPYKIQIVKQPKPRVDPNRTPSPPKIIEPEPKPVPQEEEPKEQLGPIPSDTEVPNLEKNEGETSEIIDQILESELTVSEFESSEQHFVEEIQHAVIETSENVETKITKLSSHTIEKTEEELLLEKQLADVQKQLLALSTLPSTIQATLDSVTKQLSELLPTFRLQSTSPLPSVVQETEIADEAKRRDKETAEMMKICQDRINKLSESKILEIPNIPPPPTPEQLEYIQKELEQQQLQDELTYKKQKEKNLMSELEQKQRQICERTTSRKQSSRLFGPLTPQERPLVLPGGRKWRKPKDAYNDEFIAEVLSSQAELITGTTLGVNFLKYQKPEKKIDLEKSEVYKVVHHLDRAPKRGIEVRPPKVLAADDIRGPISCN